MDFSEKDAARSKWKLTQRHSRGRGRGGRGAGGGGRGGRGGRSGAAAAAGDLGTNEDRYRDTEAEAAAAAAALGPVQRSQGADLAELLSQAEPFDQGFYHRSRVNLAAEFGLPLEAPQGGGYQGLAIDLRGLATCLELLPSNQVLDTDAFSEEGSETGEEAEELPDLPQESQQQQQQQPPPAAARQQPPAAAAVGGNVEDDLLSELLGDKSAVSSMAGSAAHPAASAKGAPAAAAGWAQPAAPYRPQQQQQQAAVLQPSDPAVQQQLQRQQQPAAEDHDDELDMLLGLGTSGGKPSGQKNAAAVNDKKGRPGGSSSLAKPPAPQAQGQSLEDWLDGL